jgi:hypothetical protein
MDNTRQNNPHEAGIAALWACIARIREERGLRPLSTPTPVRVSTR